MGIRGKLDKARVEKVLANMKRMGMDAVVITNPAALAYLMEFGDDPYERLGALCFKADGTRAYFGNIVITMNGLVTSDELPIIEHTDAENPIKDLAPWLPADGTIGLDSFMPTRFTLPLMQARPELKYVIGSPVYEEAKMIKTADEVEKLREIGRIADEIIGECVKYAAEGPSEKEMEKFINDNFKKRGCTTCNDYQVAAWGAIAAEPHHMPDDRKPQPGDVMLFDIFAEKDGYWCDISRCVFYKEVSEEHRRIYETVKAAQQAAVDLVKPGEPMCNVDLLAKKTMSDAGYGVTTGRVGHGVGMTVHEKPDCSQAETRPLEVGMCFSIEPGIYQPGDIGVRIEDVVVVTENGRETMTHFPKDIIIVG